MQYNLVCAKITDNESTIAVYDNRREWRGKCAVSFFRCVIRSLYMTRKADARSIYKAFYPSRGAEICVM